MPTQGAHIVGCQQQSAITAVDGITGTTPPAQPTVLTDTRPGSAELEATNRPGSPVATLGRSCDNRLYSTATASKSANGMTSLTATPVICTLAINVAAMTVAPIWPAAVPLMVAVA